MNKNSVHKTKYDFIADKDSIKKQKQKQNKTKNSCSKKILLSLPVVVTDLFTPFLSSALSCWI